MLDNIKVNKKVEMSIEDYNLLEDKIESLLSENRMKDEVNKKLEDELNLVRDNISKIIIRKTYTNDVKYDTLIDNNKIGKLKYLLIDNLNESFVNFKRVSHSDVSLENIFSSAILKSAILSFEKIEEKNINSIEYIGFDDIEEEIEERIKSKVDTDIKDVQNKYNQLLDEHKKTNATLDLLVNTNKSLKNECNDLTNTVNIYRSELNKSTKIINMIKDLTNKKINIFNYFSIFSKIKLHLKNNI